MKGLFLGLTVISFSFLLWFFKIINNMDFWILFSFGIIIQIVSIIIIYTETETMLVKIENKRKILTEREKILANLKTHKIKGVTKCGKGLIQGLVFSTEPINKELKEKINKEMKKDEDFLFPIHKKLKSGIK